jgi:hypothetical protein
MTAEPEVWGATHSGYVLVPPGDRRLFDPIRYMLHHDDCILLVSTSGVLLLEGLPRWCGAKRDLIDWTVQETGSAPALCSTCMPA